MIGNVNTYLTNPGSNNPQKVIDYYSNSDFEYNIRVGDYCKVTLDSNLLYWISGIVVEIDEEENAFSIRILMVVSLKFLVTISVIYSPEKNCRIAYKSYKNRLTKR